jgi:hypothetical protein
MDKLRTGTAGQFRLLVLLKNHPYEDVYRKSLDAISVNATLAFGSKEKNLDNLALPGVEWSNHWTKKRKTAHAASQTRI